MKKIVLSLSIVGLIYGCQKDQITPKSTASNQGELNQKTFNRNSEMSEIEIKVLDFGALMDSEEGGEPMSITDVVWSLEALANYRHREAEEYNMTDVKTETITLVKDETGKISIANIRAKHNEINEMLGLIEEGKSLIVLDVSIKEETDDDVTLDIITSFGFHVVFSLPFTDSWNWGFGAYTCGYTGPWLGIDAADIIPSRIHGVIQHGFMITNVVTFYVDNLQAQFLANPFGYDNGPLFGAHGTGTNVVPTICLTPVMLTHYENGLKDFAEDLKPVGQHTILHDLESASSLGSNQWDALHLASFTYGTLTDINAVIL